jgi:hypothetical protein
VLIRWAVGFAPASGKACGLRYLRQASVSPGPSLVSVAKRQIALRHGRFYVCSDMYFA